MEAPAKNSSKHVFFLHERELLLSTGVHIQTYSKPGFYEENALVKVHQSSCGADVDRVFGFSTKLVENQFYISGLLFSPVKRKML